MPLSPGSVPQQDTLVAPIIAQLMVVAGQIAGVGNLYAEVPDAPPEPGAVLFAPLTVSPKDDATNAKIVLEVNFEVLHLFRRARLQDTLAQISAAIPAWLTVLTAWPNQTLGGVAQNLNLTDMKILPYKHGNQDYLALVNLVTVRVVQNIVLS